MTFATSILISSKSDDLFWYTFSLYLLVPPQTTGLRNQLLLLLPS